jgi:chromosome segregation ATPase
VTFDGSTAAVVNEKLKAEIQDVRNTISKDNAVLVRHDERIRELEAEKAEDRTVLTSQAAEIKQLKATIEELELQAQLRG